MTEVSQYYDFSGRANTEHGVNWKEVVNTVNSGLSYYPDNEDEPGGRLLHSSANSFQVVRFSTSSGTYIRDQHHIQDDDTDSCCFVTPLCGEFQLSLPSREVALSAGDFFLSDFSQPSKFYVDSSVSGLMFRLPRKLLEADFPGISNICGKSFQGNSGCPRLALDYFASISQQSSEMSEAEFFLSCQQLTNLFSLIFDGMTDLKSAELTVQNVLLDRMKRYIRGEITNPELSATLIARAFNITPRYVQMLFKEMDITVRDYIRDLRLEYSRNLLESPLQRSRSITDIAFDAGFSSSAHFSTRFRDKYGISPRDARVSKQPTAIIDL